MLLNKNKMQNKEWNAKVIRSKISELERAIIRGRNQIPTPQEEQNRKEDAQRAIRAICVLNQRNHDEVDEYKVAVEKIEQIKDSNKKIAQEKVCEDRMQLHW